MVRLTTRAIPTSSASNGKEQKVNSREFAKTIFEQGGLSLAEYNALTTPQRKDYLGYMRAQTAGRSKEDFIKAIPQLVMNWRQDLARGEVSIF